MSALKFKHVKVLGVKTVVPEHCVDIDDELQFFDNNPKKLARQKKMIGYGRRYIASEDTSVCDMACDAAEKLFAEMSFDRNDIDLLVFVNQTPDYPAPCDACVAHGMLGLKKSCMTLDISLGCSGWPHAMMTAHALMASGSVGKALILAGDIASQYASQTNRNSAQVFGDAVSATLLGYDAEDNREATFICGTDGAGWDKLLCPFGGRRNPIDATVANYETKDAEGNDWRATHSLMKGAYVFDFTMNVIPDLIKDTVAAAGWQIQDVECYALHQANKQILETIAMKAEIPFDRTPVETFSKYANNSTNSVVTVICDQLQAKDVDKVVACAFGIGLSWGCCALHLKGMYNGGISTYVEKKPHVPVSERLDYYGKFFRQEV